jgi:lysophospholipase
MIRRAIRRAIVRRSMMKLLLRENDYTKKMEEMVGPYLSGRRESGYFERVEGQPIYYEHYVPDEAKGIVVIVHGFSEFIDKFYEVIYYFLKCNYSVWAIEQRGHGRSYRTVANPDMVQIDDYNELVDDLHYMVEKFVMNDETDGLPKILFGHSMGGAVAACFLERFPDYFDKAVLSSPMLKLRSGKLPYAVAYVYMKRMIKDGRGKEALPGSKPLGDTYVFEDGCATSRQRDEYVYNIKRSEERFRMCMPSCDTVIQFHLFSAYARNKRNAARIKAEVLLLQAENDTLVHPEGGRIFIKNVPHGRLIRMRGTKHEIYNSTDDVLRRYWNLVLDFCGGSLNKIPAPDGLLMIW